MESKAENRESGSTVRLGIDFRISDGQNGIHHAWRRSHHSPTIVIWPPSVNTQPRPRAWRTGQDGIGLKLRFAVKNAVTQVESGELQRLMDYFLTTHLRMKTDDSVRFSNRINKIR